MYNVTGRFVFIITLEIYGNGEIMKIRKAEREDQYLAMELHTQSFLIA